MSTCLSHVYNYVDSSLQPPRILVPLLSLWAQFGSEQVQQQLVYPASKTLKSLTLLVQTKLFGCFHNLANSDLPWTIGSINNTNTIQKNFIINKKCRKLMKIYLLGHSSVSAGLLVWFLPVSL